MAALKGTCKDCGEPFEMSEKETERFEKLIAENPAMQMPKRCKPCRLKKRERNQDQG